jgi:hypothetical protein
MTRTANLCFGGADYKTLYMVGQPYVSSIPVRVAGAVSLRRMHASAVDGALNLTWPAPSTGFVLQEAESLGQTAEWRDLTNAPAVSAGVKAVAVPATEAERYFRLVLK